MDILCIFVNIIILKYEKIAKEQKIGINMQQLQSKLKQYDSIITGGKPEIKKI